MLINGVPRLAGEAALTVEDEALLRGDGVVEVLRLYRGCAFALTEHLDRLEASGRGLRLPVDAATVAADVEVLEGLADGADAILRVVVTRGGRRLAMLEAAPSVPPAHRPCERCSLWTGSTIASSRAGRGRLTTAAREAFDLRVRDGAWTRANDTDCPPEPDGRMAPIDK